MRVVVVEDDHILGSSLKRLLEKHAYGVDWFQDGESGLLALADNEYGALILDINLPGISGIHVLQTVRMQGNRIPIMLLTALDRVSDKIEGLDGGGDDYLVKPFDADEFLARLRALIRRREGRVETLLKAGNVELDPSAMVVRLKGDQVDLPAKEFHLLRLLMERCGRYVTKADIEYALYDANSTVGSNTIEVIIYNLRKKFGSGLIKSLRGVGYIIVR